MNNIENAINYIKNLIAKIDSMTKVIVNEVQAYNYHFDIEIKGQKHKIIFGRDIMEDFEIAIRKYPETDYYYTLENTIKFKIYVSLGQEGLIPNLDISSELLSERREWLKDYSGDEVFARKLYSVLHTGLIKLYHFLNTILKNKTLKKHKLELKDLKDDKEYIDGLLVWYDESDGTFFSGRPNIESLGFLKAAAICEIIEKEKLKKEEQITARVVKEIDKEIYGIVSELRKSPFLGIRLPECIYEYAKQNKKQTQSKAVEAERLVIEKEQENKLDSLLDQLNPVFRKKRQGAWKTFISDNPDRLSQSANSMVELLSQVIDSVCKDRKLAEYLKEKYETREETEWIEATVKWVSETKDNLQRVKHHTEYKLEKIAKTLLEHAESIILILLE